MNCTMCDCKLGAEVKVQPTTVDKENYCPRCFVTRRMAAEPDRYNATQAVAAQCQFCHWIIVAFGALPGGSLHCNHCGQHGAVKLAIQELPLTEREKRNIEELARASGIKEPPRLTRSRS